MINLPNSFERYLASLRYLVAHSIAKHGTRKRHIENLRKIFIAEAHLQQKSTQSVDISTLFKNLLGAISSLNSDLKFSHSTSGNFYINKKIFTLLLIIICKNSNKVLLSSNGGYLYIKYSGKALKNTALLKALNGICFTEIKSEISLIILPAIESKQTSVYIESEWENLFNSFSAVKIFFN